MNGFVGLGFEAHSRRVPFLRSATRCYKEIVDELSTLIVPRMVEAGMGYGALLVAIDALSLRGLPTSLRSP